MKPERRYRIIHRIFDLAHEADVILASDPQRRERLRTLLKGLIHLFLEVMMEKYLPTILATNDNDASKKTTDGTPRT